MKKYTRNSFLQFSLGCLLHSPTKKGYKSYNPATKKMYTSMDVTFMENLSFYPNTSLQGENTQEARLWESYLPLSIATQIETSPHSSAETSPNSSTETRPNLANETEPGHSSAEINQILCYSHQNSSLALSKLMEQPQNTRTKVHSQG